MIILKLFNKSAASFGLVLFGVLAAFSQESKPIDLKGLIKDFKQDPRGPYQAIRWFCPDGSVIPANERCKEPGGIQHALHKDIVVRLARERGIYLGQILAGTAVTDFFDDDNANSRAKQYQLENYLQAIDDGWILRKARYYRGAFQAEDEEAWGMAFLKWLLSNDEIVRSQFFLVRQLTKDIPHIANDNRLLLIRTLSKNIADELPSFLDIRIKIHGQPDASDLRRVRAFRVQNQGKLAEDLDKMLHDLQRELEIVYRPHDMKTLQKYAANIPPGSPIAERLKQLAKVEPEALANDGVPLKELSRQLADLLWMIRTDLLNLPGAAARLDMIDLSNEVEGLLFTSISNWRAASAGDLLAKSHILAKASAGCGFLEIWEWLNVAPILEVSPRQESLSFSEFSQKSLYARRAVEWGTGMIRAVYDPTVALFQPFEPLAHDYIDELVRSSILLPLGESAGQLADLAAQAAGISNYMMGIKNAEQIHGINPGFALGELVVVRDMAEISSFSQQKIYILPTAPMDLKPVAGIATVSAGNLVSHVQLLARNLGIPNAVLSEQGLKDLLPFSGQTVFYAISPRGGVVMKPESELSAEEKALVSERKRPQEKIRVPIEDLDLQRTQLVRLSALRAADSGRLCGPKAANLGQLKHLFPDQVVEGLVIPFGIFRAHLEQTMHDTGTTYAQFLRETFEHQSNNESEEESERRTLARLAVLRAAIKAMPFLPDFQSHLQQQFQETFGAKLGELAVFIRSDTNMEDLKDFTGAGLNLTVVNVVQESKILQGIRDVWASPFTERSYRWRQKFLLNPENVYPSILVLPTVNVQKSGVMITSGVSSTNNDDVTVAFNRGTGGAVEGQRAESYLLASNGDAFLLAPAREATYPILSADGAVTKGINHFNKRILNETELEKLREAALDIRKKLPGSPGIVGDGPFDVELGFHDEQIILFQVRPFVENKRAQASVYLRSLDPKSPKKARIALREKL